MVGANIEADKCSLRCGHDLNSGIYIEGVAQRCSEENAIEDVIEDFLIFLNRLKSMNYVVSLQNYHHFIRCDLIFAPAVSSLIITTTE